MEKGNICGITGRNVLRVNEKEKKILNRTNIVYFPQIKFILKHG